MFFNPGICLTAQLRGLTVLTLESVEFQAQDNPDAHTFFGFLSLSQQDGDEEKRGPLAESQENRWAFCLATSEGCKKN
jgi:hypothetical protein